mgnify:FL=1
MYNIQLLNKIAKCGTQIFDENYTVSDAVTAPEGIMVRSAAMHDMEFGKELLAIARAGAGVNNIPLDKCSEQGIVVFNTPGANANAVKELAVCALLLASRKIVDGINWASTLTEDVAKAVEKGKSAFVGPEIAGKTLGIIGLGAIGAQLANTAVHLGMNVYGYDPFITVDAAWRLSKSVKHAKALDDIFANCDYISVHVPSTPDTKGMINEKSISAMKDGVRILNLARADLVVAADVKKALESGKVASYVTDFPTEEVIGVPGIIAIPHLGASTPESEDNCAVMAAEELKTYIETGNIKNSVNFPEAFIPYSGLKRIAVFHKNVPSMLAQISSALSDSNINIANMVNGSKKDNAYTLIEINGDISGDVMEKLTNIQNVVRVRVIG